MKISAFLLRSTVVAALGGLLFGFDTAVISGTTDWLKNTFELTNLWLGFTVSSALIGTIIGAIGIGRPSDILGRRRALFILAANNYCKKSCFRANVQQSRFERVNS